jgi:hypothetical protein
MMIKLTLKQEMRCGLDTLAQETVQWQVLVGTVMNIGFHKRRGISPLVKKLSFSRNTVLHEV